MRRSAAAVLALGGFAVAIGSGGGTASAQQAGMTEERGDVPSLIRLAEDRQASIPMPWEFPGMFPVLDHEALIEAASEDSGQLTFLDANELGGFRPANEGGSPFFGSGQPIFGMAAPPLLPSRVLRPLGGGDAGDRFLGRRPPVKPDSVIPKLDETFDRSRESFAFIDGIPPILDAGADDTPFPLLDAVAADVTPNCPDNLGSCPTGLPDLPGSGTTATTVPPVRPPAPTPATTARRTVTTTPRRTVQPSIPPPGTTIPPRTSTPPGTTSTPTTVPPTTVPPSTIPLTTLPTTTIPRTTVPPTTAPTTTVPTTTVPPSPTNPTTPPTTTPSAMFVLGNQVEADADPDSVAAVTRDLCLSNVQPSNANPDCDRLFAFGDGPGRSGFMRLGRQYFVNLTLWNVRDLSTVDATDLRVYAPDACTSAPTPAASADSICKGIQLKIQRYQDAGRTIPMECVYGGGTGNACQWHATKTLADFGATYTSMAAGAPIGAEFPVNRKAYLRIFVKLEDNGVDANGFGKDNRYIDQRANLRFRWQMQAQ